MWVLLDTKTFFNKPVRCPKCRSRHWHEPPKSERDRWFEEPPINTRVRRVIENGKGKLFARIAWERRRNETYHRRKQLGNNLGNNRPDPVKPEAGVPRATTRGAFRL